MRKHKKTKLNILEIGKSVIRQEIISLEQVKGALSDSFVEAVEAIACCKGKVIVTGMGKSAIIGQKIAATLNSTGTTAVFMHAADAAHGDLGLISPGDIVIVLSKSGETEEIKVLMPLLNRLGNKTLAMVNESNSYLAQHSDISIIIPVESEADPHNLAPTASTTAQLAVGDALAIALLSHNGFTPAQFAQLHPGGNLGKKLHLRVKDVIQENTVPKINPQSSIRETIIEMTTHRLGATGVVGDDGQLRGIITDGDLRRMLKEQNDISGLCARDIMTDQPKTIDQEALAVEALHIMRQNSITQLMVMNADDQYIGVIHIHDLVREGIL